MARPESFGRGRRKSWIGRTVVGWAGQPPDGPRRDRITAGGCRYSCRMTRDHEGTVGSVRPAVARSHFRPGVPACCGLAALLTFLAGIGGPSLWVDEGHTWQYAREPLGSMLTTVLGSTNAVEAVYYVLIHSG